MVHLHVLELVTLSGNGHKDKSHTDACIESDPAFLVRVYDTSLRPE
jgi:hypothetical protein